MDRVPYSQTGEVVDDAHPVQRGIERVGIEDGPDDELYAVDALDIRGPTGRQVVEDAHRS